MTSHKWLSQSDVSEIQQDMRAWHQRRLYGELGVQCDRSARRAVWAWRWRLYRAQVIFWAAFMLAAAVAVAVVIEIGFRSAGR